MQFSTSNYIQPFELERFTEEKDITKTNNCSVYRILFLAQAM